MKCINCDAKYHGANHYAPCVPGTAHQWDAELPPSRNSSPSLQASKEEIKRVTEEMDAAYNERKAGKKYRADDSNMMAELDAINASNYVKIGADVGRLVSEKQAAYGDSFGKSGQIMAIFYPNGIPPEKLDDSLTIVRVIDKLFRIATDRDALGENPWRDVAGYALLEIRKSLARNQIK